MISEAPVIVLPMHSGFNFFVNKNWIYTAISRAQKICITVGQMSSIRKTIRTEMSINRVTRLKEKMREYETIL